jgi:aspartate-semialdehyde dehydrogenase
MDSRRIHKNPNIAIVGSTSLLGKELKEMIEDEAFPKGRLLLLETEEYAGLLQEFAGEIHITQIISPDAFEDIDIAFFACSPEIMNSYISSGARLPELTIDLTQTDQKGRLFLHGISDPRDLPSRGYYINPHPAVIVLARVLSILHNAAGIRFSAVTIMEPASERGGAGVDELQEQTVNLLNFQQVESRTFNGQIAFNMLVDRKVSDRNEERILKQLSELLGNTFPLPMVASIQAPVFHSHGFSLFVQLLEDHGLEELQAKLKLAGPGIEWSDSPSPVSVVGTDKIHIGRIHRDVNHAAGYSLWIVADNLRLAAANALRTAENIILTPAVGM